MKKLLLLILLALGLSAEAQQTCFGSSCGSAASSSPATGADVANVTTCTDSVGTDAWACSPASCAATLGATTPPVVVTVGTANTGAATFAFCGAAAKAVVRPVSASVSTALSTGDVLAGQKIYLAYSVANDNWQMGSVSAVAPTKALNDATYCPDVGASDAYVCSMVSAPSSYAAGMLVTLSANTANTGTASVNVNSLGVKTIVRSDGTTLQTGDITATMPVPLEYDGTNFRALGTLRSFITNEANGASFNGGTGSTSSALKATHSSNGTSISTAAQIPFAIQNLNSTAGNISALVFQDSASFGATAVVGKYDDHTTHYGSLEFMTRGASGLITNLTISSAGLTTGWLLARSPTYASGSDVALTVQGSLTGNTQEWKNSGGTVFAKMLASPLGSSTTSNFFNVTGTLPSTLSSETYGVRYNITGAGSSGQFVAAERVNLLSGFTGSASTAAIYGANTTAASGAGRWNAGVFGYANSSSAASMNHGVIGSAINSGAGAKVGGLFTLADLTAATPAAVGNAAVVGDTAGVSGAYIYRGLTSGVQTWGISTNGTPVYASGIPAVSNTSADSCGTTAATIAGTAETGVITVGATSGTSCTLTFVVAAPTRRQCIATNETSGLAVQSTYSSTTVSILAGTFAASDKLAYICQVY